MPKGSRFSRDSTRTKCFRRLSLGLASAAFALGIAIPAAASPQTALVAPSERGPALWVVQDADTTIFLFGTFHALDENSAWFNRSIRAAFNSSDELVLETIVPEDPAVLHAMIANQTAANEPRAGQPVYADRPATSFVASAGQAMAAGRSRGMSVDNGADFVLRRAAESSGKPVEGLESFEFQLKMFGGLQDSTPQASHQSAKALPGFIGNMEAAWKRGDNADFVSILGTVRSQSPATYKTLFADRNANWAGWIANRMQQPGTVFVAVGTGHLVGPDSVQQQLAARGITSARIS